MPVLPQCADSRAVQGRLAGGRAVEHVAERSVCCGVLGLSACRNGNRRAGCSAEIVFCGHACAVGGSDAVLQAGHGVVAACVTDDEASAAVVVGASGQRCSGHRRDLRSGRIGDALHLEVGRHNTGRRAVLVRTGVQRGGGVGRCSYLGASLNCTSAGQGEGADGRLCGNGGLKPLGEDFGQDIGHALALGREHRRAVLALGQVAHLSIATGPA